MPHLTMPRSVCPDARDHDTHSERQTKAGGEATRQRVVTGGCFIVMVEDIFGAAIELEAIIYGVGRKQVHHRKWGEADCFEWVVESFAGVSRTRADRPRGIRRPDDTRVCQNTRP